VPLQIPGALVHRTPKPVMSNVEAAVDVLAIAEPVAQLDRARDERELEGGGALRYRRRDGHRGVGPVVFGLRRTKSSPPAVHAAPSQERGSHVQTQR
jgi:hypothetical protein